MCAFLNFLDIEKSTHQKSLKDFSRLCDLNGALIWANVRTCLMLVQSGVNKNLLFIMHQDDSDLGHAD
jgi:hypothetical protein